MAQDDSLSCLHHCFPPRFGLVEVEHTADSQYFPDSLKRILLFCDVHFSNLFTNNNASISVFTTLQALFFDFFMIEVLLLRISLNGILFENKG